MNQASSQTGVALNTSDIIALLAVFIAVVVPLIQTWYERRREWHSACELLFHGMELMYEEIKKLAQTPDTVNHISYQQCLKQRNILLKHYGKRFFFQKEKIKEAEKIIIDNLMGIPEKVEYEELINKGHKIRKQQSNYYCKFIKEIRSYTTQAIEALVK